MQLDDNFGQSQKAPTTKKQALETQNPQTETPQPQDQPAKRGRKPGVALSVQAVTEKPLETAKKVVLASFSLWEGFKNADSNGDGKTTPVEFGFALIGQTQSLAVLAQVGTQGVKSLQKLKIQDFAPLLSYASSLLPEGTSRDEVQERLQAVLEGAKNLVISAEKIKKAFEPRVLED